MKEAIQSIKARMFDVCVEELFRTTKGEERIWLGRIRDAIKELGAQTVYEIGRGAAFPEAYTSSLFGDKKRIEKSVQEAMSGKQTQKFVTREDEKLIKEGKINSEIMEKLAAENRTRRLLLEDKYGGAKHKKMLGWK